MRRSARFGAALAAGLLAATPALAHPGHDGSSLAAGLMHPLGGFDHMLAMTAVGVMAARRGGAALFAWPAAFVAAMLAAYGLGVIAPGAAVMEPMALATVIVLGALAASSRQLPLAAGLAVIAASGACHGYLHGAEAPQGAGLAFPLGFAASTAALHGLGVLIGLAVRPWRPRLQRLHLQRHQGAGM